MEQDCITVMKPIQRFDEMPKTNGCHDSQLAGEHKKEHKVVHVSIRGFKGDKGRGLERIRYIHVSLNKIF